MVVVVDRRGPLMRGWGRAGAARWLPLLLAAGTLYLFLLFASQFYVRTVTSSYGEITRRRKSSVEDNEDGEGKKKPVVELQEVKANTGREPPTEAAKPFSYTFKSSQYPAFEVEDVLTASGVSFRERMTARVDTDKPKKVILSWDAGHSAENLGGCPDWHCEFTTDHSRGAEADVVLLTNGVSFVRNNSAQYLLYYSQESPKNMGSSVPSKNYFNMSLGYRHDTATSSPYGYTVKLSKERRLEDVVDVARLKGKSKAAAWFVSHCSTNSRREDLVAALQKHIKIDVYGGCPGAMACPRGGTCENMLNTDYFFYMALENSICTDYITEKVWNQGYGRDILPVVLKRSIASGRLPPHSFLAADDYSTVEAMALHIASLIKNQTAYLEYFQWRRNYQTVFLNGNAHDELERPWGFCQACRLAWERPRKTHVIEDFSQWWEGSCEADGATVNKILNRQ